MSYEELNTGDILQGGDEYATSFKNWKAIPDFMVGDVIKESSTKWRRIVKEDKK